MNDGRGSKGPGRSSIRKGIREIRRGEMVNSFKSKESLGFSEADDVI